MYPLSWGLSLISPWILAKTLGGASPMALTLRPRGRTLRRQVKHVAVKHVAVNPAVFFCILPPAADPLR